MSNKFFSYLNKLKHKLYNFFSFFIIQLFKPCYALFLEFKQNFKDKLLLNLILYKKILKLEFKNFLTLNSFVKFLSIDDHRLIGKLYIYFGGFSAIIGSFLSFIIRLQLSTHDGFLNLNLDVYNFVVTTHGIIMIFMFVIPILIGGFGNLFLPTMIGASKMAFPKLNNLSF